MHAFTELRESKKTDASSCISVCLLFSLSLSLSLYARSAFVCVACSCDGSLSFVNEREKAKGKTKKKGKKESGRKERATFGRKISFFVHLLVLPPPPPEKGKKGKIDDDDDEEEEEEKVASLHFSEREREKERERERKRREEKPKVAERFVSARVERRVVWKYFYERTECSVRRLSRGTDRKSEKAKRVPSLPPLLSTTR